MHVRYGTFNFEPWEAALSVYANFIRSPRGFKQYQNVRFTITGDVCIDTGAADVNTRLGQIITAFSSDGQSCGLVDDLGNPTVHWMPNTASESTNLTDVQVVSQNFPDTTQGEFATGRKFQLVVASLYDAGASQIIQYSDTLQRYGNAGPQWTWERNKFWGFYPRKLAPNTMQTIIHYGTAVGVDTWPLPPTPFYSQPFEQNDIRQVTHHSPQRFPEGYVGFTTSWRYTYRLPTYDDVTGPTVI